MLNYENDDRNCGCNCNCGCPMNHADNMMTSNLGVQTPMPLSAGYNMTANNCNCCGNPSPMPRIPTYSYEFTNIKNEDCEEKVMARDEMLQQIRCLGFAIVELAEYLDTHVDDEKALCLHKEYARKMDELKDKYQRVYGPLTINFPCNKWRWIEEPWPWERGNF